MNKHQRILGILFTVYGLLILLVTSTIAANNSEIPALGVFLVIAVGTLTFSSGYALLMKLSWAHKATLASSVIALLSFPIGTILAVYYFWHYKSHVYKPT